MAVGNGDGCDKKKIVLYRVKLQESLVFREAEKGLQICC